MRSWKLLLTWTARAYQTRRQTRISRAHEAESWTLVGRGNLIAVGQTSISGRRERRDERDEFDPISSYPLHPFPRKSRDSSSDGSFFLDLKGGGEIRLLFFTSVKSNARFNPLWCVYSFFTDQFEIEKWRKSNKMYRFVEFW